MAFVVGDIMQVNVKTVDAETPLPELEERMVAERISGYPVIEGGQLVGMISRSDVVQHLYQEQELAETTSDFYFDENGFHEMPLNSYEAIASRVGERIGSMTVRDAMNSAPVSVTPTSELAEAAALMVQHRVHRLPVVEQGRLVGIISTTNLVQLFADRRVEATL